MYPSSKRSSIHEQTTMKLIIVDKKKKGWKEKIQILNLFLLCCIDSYFFCWRSFSSVEPPVIVVVDSQKLIKFYPVS